MRIDIVTVFPDYLLPLELSLIGKARAAGLLDVRIHDLREWATDRHRTVDDTPFGGGAGMVMRPDIWGSALDSLLRHDDDDGKSPHLIFPTPSGQRFTQRIAESLATAEHLVFACGRYEGIDSRVPQYYREIGYSVSEFSLGDFVLNGGEAAVLAMIEAITRLVPGVIGNPESLAEESFSGEGLLEYPIFTKPPVWRGMAVPEILLSGHHARIAAWRREQSLERTADRRPDLL
ncbi:MAG: tRNA (guanosine(37)-N1)-methyltransferase TrmD [Promicromonosporaceae bacterium]|nr:tRNA (guanosine(37)-N1)-methyltransferase TrmD [Promicromonosporaceae bacterium]